MFRGDLEYRLMPLCRVDNKKITVFTELSATLNYHGGIQSLYLNYPYRIANNYLFGARYDYTTRRGKRFRDKVKQMCLNGNVDKTINFSSDLRHFYMSSGSLKIIR